MAIDRQDEHPRRDGDPERGASLYAAQCATCHGPEAKGEGPRPESRGEADPAPRGGISPGRPRQPPDGCPASPPSSIPRRRPTSWRGSGGGVEVRPRQPLANRSRASRAPPRMPASSPRAAGSIWMRLSRVGQELGAGRLADEVDVRVAQGLDDAAADDDDLAGRSGSPARPGPGRGSGRRGGPP